MKMSNSLHSTGILTILFLFFVVSFQHSVESIKVERKVSHKERQSIYFSALNQASEFISPQEWSNYFNYKYIDQYDAFRKEFTHCIHSHYQLETRNGLKSIYNKAS